MWIFPILAVLAARMLSDLTQLPSTKNKAGFRWLILSVALASILLNFVDLTFGSIRWYSQENNMVAAEGWIERNIPSGALMAHDWYGMPSLWDQNSKQRFLALLETVPGASDGISEAINGKAVYTGYLGYQWFPPTEEMLMTEKPEWVVTKSSLEPPTIEPLVGYNSQHLVDLHRRMANFYGFLRGSGSYELAQEFSEGPGPVIRLYRRVK